MWILDKRLGFLVTNFGGKQWFVVAASSPRRRGQDFCDISPIAFKDGKRIAEAIPMTRLEDLPPNTEAGHVAGAVCARFASR